MSTTTTQESPAQLTELIDQIFADLRGDQPSVAREVIAGLLPQELAELLEALPPKQRLELWDLVPDELDSTVLPWVSDSVRAELIGDMEEESLVAAAGMMAEADLALILENLPDAQYEQVISSLDADHRERVQRVLSFDDDSAGRLMSSNVLSVRADVTIAVVLRWLRRHRDLPPHTDALMVIDEQGLYLGRLSMAQVVTGDPDVLVGERMTVGAESVRLTTPISEVVRLFEHRDLVAVAVLDDEGQLVGRITVDEVIDQMRAQTEEQLLKQAGLSEADELFSPILPSAARRALWLGVNLLTVFLAAAVIGRFEKALDQIVALAILLPVVASMGGIAGSQALALTLRGMALDRIAASNVLWLVRKEIAIGLLNGLTWALVVGLVAWAWFGDPDIGGVIAAAMLINLVAAAACGVLVPLGLRRVGADPSLAGAVVLTTVTDVVGFLSFLGLATLFLL